MRFPSGHLLALIVWLGIFAAVYLFFDARLKPTIATVSKPDLSQRQVVIPRSRDGHYFVEGEINGKQLVFVVNTGATMVSVSTAFAREAGLPRGERARFDTAGGGHRRRSGGAAGRHGLRHRGSPLSIGVGILLDEHSPALLGQNFLRRVQVIQPNDSMILRLKPGT